MRPILRLIVLLAACVIAGPVGSATAKNPAKPLVFRLHWRVVVRTRLQYAVASNQYIAILTGTGGGLVTLLDQQTGKRKTLSPPGCSIPNDTWDTSSQPLIFGYPWLLVECGQPPPSYRETYDLYNIQTGEWTPFLISTHCEGDCHAVGVGRDWVKVLTDEGAPMYGPSDYYLQNIKTGLFERDPATPNGKVFDDLNGPSGATALCAPVRYPYVPDGHNPQIWDLGTLSFYGQFALTFGQEVHGTSVGDPIYRLRRCGSKLKLTVYDYTGAGPVPTAENEPIGSSHAVIQGVDNVTLHGWLLPSLRRFTIRPAVGDKIATVALTNRTIYIRTLDTRRLLAATLPQREPAR
jgi:hypothetical protein